MTTATNPLPPACTVCESEPETVQIVIRGCTHRRCARCGAALLRRLAIVEPGHTATVTVLALPTECDAAPDAERVA